MEGFEVKNGVAIFPEGIKEIPEYAFRDNEELVKADIPQGVTSIGHGAFIRCKNLKSVSLPIGLKIIDKSAFYECRKLQSISLPEGLAEIRDDAFGECRKIKSVEIPIGVKEIGAYAFSDCRKLESITLPNTVEHIGKGAFMRNAIEAIELPDTLPYLEEFTFYECGNLKSIKMSKSTKLTGCWNFPRNNEGFKLIYPDGSEKSGNYINNADNDKKFYYIPIFGINYKTLRASYRDPNNEELNAEQRAFEDDMLSRIRVFYEERKGNMESAARQGIDFTSPGIYVEDFENNLYAVVMGDPYREILYRYE